MRVSPVHTRAWVRTRDSGQTKHTLPPTHFFIMPSIKFYPFYKASVTWLSTSPKPTVDTRQTQPLCGPVSRYAGPIFCLKPLSVVPREVMHQTQKLHGMHEEHCLSQMQDGAVWEEGLGLGWETQELTLAGLLSAPEAVASSAHTGPSCL